MPKYIKSKQFEKSYHKYTKNNTSLKKRVANQLDKFEQSHEHPGLHSHKVKLNGEELYSIRLTGDLRAIYYWHGDTAVLVNLGTHDEMYGK